MFDVNFSKGVENKPKRTALNKDFNKGVAQIISGLKPMVKK